MNKIRIERIDQKGNWLNVRLDPAAPDLKVTDMTVAETVNQLVSNETFTQWNCGPNNVVVLIHR
tara:strand:+ start:1127 stop:1318 length:192 start_codon:yes stop_codon:yes gene_type:complete